MNKPIAKQLFEIATYKDDLACSCNCKAKDVKQGHHETTWIFKDNSTLTLDDFGSVRVNGKFQN